MLVRICQISQKLFMRYGIRSITMDDVARELSISKKTLYQYVADKDDLVKKTISIHLEEIDQMVQTVMSKEENAIQQILKIADMMILLHNEVSEGLLFDLKKFHPETFDLLTEHRERTMFVQVTNNLSTGIKQKLYRKDIPVELTASMYMNLVYTSIDGHVGHSKNKSFPEKYAALINYHFHAICTEEGLQYFNKNKKTLTNITLQ